MVAAEFYKQPTSTAYPFVLFVLLSLGETVSIPIIFSPPATEVRFDAHSAVTITTTSGNVMLSELAGNSMAAFLFDLSNVLSVISSGTLQQFLASTGAGSNRIILTRGGASVLTLNQSSIETLASGTLANVGGDIIGGHF